jgi:glycine dehydrogenase subunit 1
VSYLPHTADDVREMLSAIGAKSIDDLFALIPAEHRYPRLDLPGGEDETTLLRRLHELQKLNLTPASVPGFLGGGARRHFIPAAVSHLVARSEFATSYGLSHSELRQGILQVQYEFQSFICLLTGLDVANATLYDGASALGEAALMTARATERRRVIIAGALNPAYRQVLQTYATGYGIHVDQLPWDQRTGTVDPDQMRRVVADGLSAVVVQHPNFFGALEPVDDLAAAAHQHGCLVIGVVDPVSLGMLKPPGEWGADVAVGEGQALGNPLQGGGPYLGFLALRESLLPQLPGAVVGTTVDADGRRAFALAGTYAKSRLVQREHAKSNVGTVSVLPAFAAVVHLALLGPEGFRQVATSCFHNAHHLADRLVARRSSSLRFDAPFFNEFVVNLNAPAEDASKALASRDILGGIPLGRWWPDLRHSLLIAATEMNTIEEIEALVGALDEWL